MKSEIWLIEDDEYLIELTKSVLERKGFLIRSFLTGQEAVTALSEELPNLIIMDNLMPDQSGSEICRSIKSNPATKDIPVLLTTGQVYWEEIERGPDDMFKPDDYLIKPFEIEQLLTKIKKLLSPH